MNHAGRTSRWTGLFSLAAMLLASAFLSAAPQSPRLVTLRAAHVSLLQDLVTGGAKGEGRSPDEGKTQEQVHRGWSLLGQWASAYLDEHPHATAKDLAYGLEQLRPSADSDIEPLEAGAIRLRPGVFAITAAYFFGDGAAGTFFIVAKDTKGQHRLAWHVLDIAKAHFERRDELGRWAYLSSIGYYNGSLIPAVHPLPPTRSGHPRFYIHAYQCAHGGTRLMQASLWEWDGRAARSLLIHSFLQAADDDGQSFDGRHLRYCTKESTETFLSFGGCIEPRGVWSVRVTPGGVQDLGHHWRSPHAQLVHELCTRLRKGKEASDLAAPAVIAWMKERFQPETSEKREAVLAYYLGMYLASNTLHRPGGDLFHLQCDEADLTFRITRRRGRPYILDCRETKE